jgi:tRNA threonylcarbamoyl adenosine modification protein (Sua5/YciO/YrdC/YwlC family)
MIHYNVHPVNPQTRFIEHAARILKNEDGIAVYPTDTVYGIGCCAANPKAINKIGDILERDKKRLFSFIFRDFTQMSMYVKIENWQYKLMRRYLPGPYTFILPATNFVPKKVCPKRKTVGVRLPDNPVCMELSRVLGEPIANTSINIPGGLRGSSEEVHDAVKHYSDIMLDTGDLDCPEGSTIIDLTEGEPVIIRKGKGEWNG